MPYTGSLISNLSCVVGFAVSRGSEPTEAEEGDQSLKRGLLPLPPVISSWDLYAACVDLKWFVNGAVLLFIRIGNTRERGKQRVGCKSVEVGWMDERLED